VFWPASGPSRGGPFIPPRAMRVGHRIRPSNDECDCGVGHSRQPPDCSAEHGFTTNGRASEGGEEDEIYEGAFGARTALLPDADDIGTGTWKQVDSKRETRELCIGLLDVSRSSQKPLCIIGDARSLNASPSTSPPPTADDFRFVLTLAITTAIVFFGTFVHIHSLHQHCQQGTHTVQYLHLSIRPIFLVLLLFG